MNKNLSSEVQNNYKNNYTMIAQELKLINNHPYKELCYDIEQKLKEGLQYTIEGYKFEENIPLEIKLTKFNNDDLLIYVLIFNSWIYREIDDESEYSHVLTKHIDKDRHLIFGIINALEFLENLRDVFTYCKFTDHLIEKKLSKKQLKIRLQKKKLCNREINECIVCYDPVHENLNCSQCGKHLCRVCEFQITVPKCPNCRHKYMFDEDDDEDE